MVNTVTMATAKHANVIRMLGDVRHKITDLKTRLAAWAKRLDRAKQRILRNLTAVITSPKLCGNGWPAYLAKSDLGSNKSM
ncbi:MAG: hypothetical protein Ct9H300mP32_5660 [Verrucomicrobiota bacterium]|nr:MAG: hypothetical protein Ct9H300mP32_5660 [Verrucomicrobiota bacterium]